jgi:hypothetical protein
VPEGHYTAPLLEKRLSDDGMPGGWMPLPPGVPQRKAGRMGRPYVLLRKSGPDTGLWMDRHPVAELGYGRFMFYHQYVIGHFGACAAALSDCHKSFI